MHCKWLNNKVTLHNLNCVTARWQLSGIQFTRCELCYSRVAIVQDPIYWVAIVLHPGGNGVGPNLLGASQCCYSWVAIVQDPIYRVAITFCQ